MGNFSNFNKIKVALSPTEVIDSLGPYKSCGFPYGDTPICESIRISGPLGFFLAGQGYLYPGMSGGPLFDVSTKTVIGVNSRVYNSTSLFSPIIGFFKSVGIKVE